MIFNASSTKFSIPSDAVFIGRPSKWGNPFSIGKDGDRADVIAKFKAHIEANPVLYKACQDELKDKHLVCYCTPLPCHGEILQAIANPTQPQPC